ALCRTAPSIRGALRWSRCGHQAIGGHPRSSASTCKAETRMKGDKRASGQAPASPAVSGSTPPDGTRAGGAAPPPSPTPSSLPNRILGSLRDALNAAGRDDRSGEISLAPRGRSQQTEAPRSAAAPVATAVSKTGDAPGPAQRDGRTATREERHVE